MQFSWKRVKQNTGLIIVVFGLSYMLITFITWALGMTQIDIGSSGFLVYLLLISTSSQFVFDLGAITFSIGILLFVNQKFKELKKP